MQRNHIKAGGVYHSRLQYTAIKAPPPSSGGKLESPTVLHKQLRPVQESRAAPPQVEPSVRGPAAVTGAPLLPEMQTRSPRGHTGTPAHGGVAECCRFSLHQKYLQAAFCLARAEVTSAAAAAETTIPRIAQRKRLAPCFLGLHSPEY